MIKETARRKGNRKQGSRGERGNGGRKKWMRKEPRGRKDTEIGHSR